MKSFFSLVLTCMVFCSTAQTTRSPFDFETALSFNPFVLLGTDQTAMLGAEHRLNNRLSLVLDAGYIFGSYYFQDNVSNGTSGFTVRPAVKLYGKRNPNTSFLFQVSYKQVGYKITDWLGKACVAGVPSYEQLQNFTYRKKVLSFNVMAGQLYRLSERILVELEGGFGVKFKSQRPTETNTCYRNNESGSVFQTFRETYTSLNVP